MRSLTDEQVRYFKREGYIHLPQFFSQDEVVRLREACRMNRPGDSMCRPEFGDVMFSQKLIDTMKDLLGEELVYPGLSLTRTNDLNAERGRFFHTDTVDDDYDFTREYPILNTGIYLQDHANYSNSLKIAPRSHTRKCITSKNLLDVIKNAIACIKKTDWQGLAGVLSITPAINIPSKPGDLIIWYVRTHHSGYGIRLKLFPNLSLPPIIENWIPDFLRLPDNPERNVMLSIFAAPSKYLDAYIKKQIIKGYRKDHYLNNACLETDDMKARAKKLNITIRNDGYHYVKNPENKMSSAAEYA